MHKHAKKGKGDFTRVSVYLNFKKMCRLPRLQRGRILPPVLRTLQLLLHTPGRPVHVVKRPLNATLPDLENSSDLLQVVFGVTINVMEVWDRTDACLESVLCLSVDNGQV